MTLVAAIDLVAEAIQQLAKLFPSVATTDAAILAQAIADITDALSAAAHGTVDPTTAKTQINALVAALQADDAAADAALGAKFPVPKP